MELIVNVIQKDFKRETYREARKCQRLAPGMSFSTLFESDATTVDKNSLVDWRGALQSKGCFLRVCLIKEPRPFSASKRVRSG